MKKVIYLIGIYSICVNLHELERALFKKIDKECSNREKNEKKGVIGFKSEAAKKPMNKIGFEIPHD